MWIALLIKGGYDDVVVEDCWCVSCIWAMSQKPSPVCEAGPRGDRTSPYDVCNFFSESIIIFKNKKLKKKPLAPASHADTLSIKPDTKTSFVMEAAVSHLINF